jgi:hypothetical protein
MTSLFKALVAAASIATAGYASLGSASAGSFCEAQVAPLNTQIDAKVQPALNEIDNGIADVRKAGRDPDSIAFKMPDGSFKTLPELRNLVLAQKAAAQGQLVKAIADCNKDLKPYQNTADALVAVATGGLNKLLPERMTHIDMGEILVAGKPLGGSGALIPHFREQLLGALGLATDRGEVTKFLRNPWHSITNIFH